MRNRKIVCSTGEVVHNYNNYLQTEHWKLLRIRVAEEHNYTCLRCYGIFRAGFHIHHNTYKRLGKEKLTDLGFYCNRCHAVIHNDRKNKKAFNRQYSNTIMTKMLNFNEEQIERVIEFIDKVARDDPNFRKMEKRKAKKSSKK
ncbi:hypothetical protein [Bacillus bingmayongensis]|uniref:hypothetical protein n=1 Tax=Bacillus bingmayongensis TaxID=1150157 RepID=UPI00037E2431|nr:hypothetical protein [Bacillus bingmayongensis]MBY0595143.1 hypothetical protein [Bacillus bingmayongensis]